MAATATAEKIETAPEKPKAQPPLGKRPLKPDELLKASSVYGVPFFVWVNDVFPTYADLFTSWFFRGIASKLAVGNKIEVRHENMTLIAELVVRGCDPHNGQVIVSELSRVDLPPLTFEQTIKEAYAVEYRGAKDMHVIIRAADGKLMDKGIRDKQEALRKIKVEYEVRRL